MNDPDGIAFLLWFGIFGLVVVFAALGVETILSRPSRGWVRKLRNLERARIDWQARVIETQCFWKDKP